MLRLACPRAASGAEAEKGVAVPEVPLWPEGSIVLQRGIEALATEAGAHTHPSCRLYRAPHNPSGAAVLVFPGGGDKRLAINADAPSGPTGPPPTASIPTRSECSAPRPAATSRRT